VCAGKRFETSVEGEDRRKWQRFRIVDFGNGIVNTDIRIFRHCEELFFFFLSKELKSEIDV
jgi:uncharacterized Fe-S cluster-containing radical SAM superfamily protein